MFNINYGIIVVTEQPKLGDTFVNKQGEITTNIVHFVGYEGPITQDDIDLLRIELETDKELGFVGRMSELYLVEAPSNIVEYFRDAIGPIE